jgi:hypothetical protein
MPSRVVADGLPQPAMWLTRDAASMQREGWAQADVDQHQQSMQAAFSAARAGAHLVRIPGTFHADFTDIPAVLPLAGPVDLAGPIAVERAHGIINACAGDLRPLPDRRPRTPAGRARRTRDPGAAARPVTRTQQCLHCTAAAD